MLHDAVQVLLSVVVGGGCVYYLLALLAVHAQLARRSVGSAPPGDPVSFSVLKPLAGNEPELQANLAGFFELDYADYELLFAASAADDPALVLAGKMAQRHGSANAVTLAVGEPASANAKVHSLAAMTAAASGEVLVISDSDIRTDARLLSALARHFQDPRVGVVTCPYRAVAGRSAWSRLEALGMNTEFWSGVLVAQFLAPMDFAVGPTMAIRRSCLEALGGWDRVSDYLAEDFQLGRLARRAGFEVRLAHHVVEHRIGSSGLGENLAHRLRWRRSTRRSRPAGYWGEIFANPLPWALLLPAAAPEASWAWGLLGACACLRLTVALAVGRAVLGFPLGIGQCLLVPVQDALSLALWMAGAFGRRIVWRQREYELMPDGRIRRVER